MEREGKAVKNTVVPPGGHDGHTHDGHDDDAEIAIKNPREVQRWLSTPEAVSQIQAAEARLNQMIPLLNAMMASNPVPGKVFAPVEPMKEGDLQRVFLRAAAEGSTELNIPQLEAFRQWRETAISRMTNGTQNVEGKK